MECPKHVCNTHGAEQKTEAFQGTGQPGVYFCAAWANVRKGCSPDYEIWLKRAKLSPPHRNVLVSGGGIGARHRGSNSHENLAKSVKFSEPNSIL